MFNEGTTVDPFTIERFQEALHEKFILRASPEEELALKLISVQELGAQFGKVRSGKRTPFSALFRGPKSPWAKQHTYDLENERLGRLQIFVVPLGPDGDGMIYEAVFS